MASRRNERPDGDAPDRPTPGEAAAPRGPHIRHAGAGRSRPANDNGFRGAARRTRRAARTLTWVAVAAVVGIVVVVAVAVI